jgi:hypothetical protein
MLGLVPLFAAAGLLVVQTMLARPGHFRDIMGDSLAWADGFTSLAFVWFCHQALVNRRHPALHGGWLLITPLPLVMAVVTRLPIDPPGGPDLPLRPSFDFVFNIAMVVMLLCAAALWRWQPRKPAPFIAAIAMTLLEWAGYYLAPTLSGWHRFTTAIGAAPVAMIAGIGFTIGAAAMWHGWRAAAAIQGSAARG